MITASYPSLCKRGRKIATLIVMDAGAETGVARLYTFNHSLMRDEDTK